MDSGSIVISRLQRFNGDARIIGNRYEIDFMPVREVMTSNLLNY